MKADALDHRGAGTRAAAAPAPASATEHGEGGWGPERTRSLEGAGAGAGWLSSDGLRRASSGGNRRRTSWMALAGVTGIALEEGSSGEQREGTTASETEVECVDLKSR